MLTRGLMPARKASRLGAHGQQDVARSRSSRRLARLAQRLADHHGAGHCDVERAQAGAASGSSAARRRRHGRHPARRRIRARTAARRSARSGGRDSGRGRARREQHQLEVRAAPPLLERRPGGVPRQRHPIEVVHSGAAEGAVGDRKARRLDDVRRDPEAGARAAESCRYSARCRARTGRSAWGLGVRRQPARRNVRVRQSSLRGALCDAAIAGLPMAGKGANRTVPDCAASAFPGPYAARPFAATGGVVGRPCRCAAG